MQENIILLKNFINVRKLTEDLCLPLANEDCVVQPIVDVSPPKWHLGHTSWFFETLILQKYKKNYRLYDKNYPYLFNSYYESLGKRILRTDRGNITRPGVEDIYKYRHYVTQEMAELLENISRLSKEVISLVELGLNHEQQHQELLVTDIKYILGNNPLFPSYLEYKDKPVKYSSSVLPENYLEIEENIFSVGFNGTGFCYDNETGAHKVYLHNFRIMDRLITNAEYMEFMESGAYHNFELWLSDGWEWVKANNIEAPLYWHKIDNKWNNYTLSGLKPVEESAPVAHVSYYESDAFARWKRKRLPAEFEWETACKIYSPEINEDANFLDSKMFSTVAKKAGNNQFFGDAWEWTGSSYLPYPFYKREKGVLGEYNGKFMINQMVLRGGSCATPKSHIRASYRNFFQPDKRWQFTGIRLAENI